MKRALWLLVAALGCTTPTHNGEPVDPATIQRAERACRESAVARYGAAPSPSVRTSEPSQCDPKSWLCRRAERWMMDADNPLSDATPRDRLVHQHVRKCMNEKGYSLP